MYRALFDHLATRIDAETAHRLGFAGVRLGSRALPRATGRPVRAMGIDFPAVLGLAAGFDKNAVGIDALARLGFGFVEVGTVTAKAQPGNPRPRLFRLPADRAVVNRMGFNNDGAEVVANRLKLRANRHASLRQVRTVIGVNIGKSKVTPEAEAVDDYRSSARLLAPYADYLVVNVSSPNTPGLRDLQAVDKLQPILAGVRGEVGDLPLLVKIAPDLADADVLAVADLALAEGLAGVVATNTTISREGLRTSTQETGGLSGAPLRARALDVTRVLRDRLGPEPTIIGVGGIGGVLDAEERLAAGADLLQAYTAFVYEGPMWPARVNRALAGRRYTSELR